MKKGFTLIELLAVIIVLGIIALIAVPKITDAIENANKGAVQTSAKHYVDALNDKIALYAIDDISSNDIEDGIKQVGDIDVDVKGDLPTNGTIKIENGKVKEAEMEIKGYTVKCISSGKCTATKKIQETKTYVYYASEGNGLTGLDDPNKLTESPTNKYAYVRYEVKDNSLQNPQVCLKKHSNEDGNCINPNEYAISKEHILASVGFDESTWEQNQDESFIWTYGSINCYIYDSDETVECMTADGGVRAENSGEVLTYAKRFACKVRSDETVECYTY